MSFLLGGETRAPGEGGGDLALRQIWSLNPVPSDHQPGGFLIQECVKVTLFLSSKAMPGLCEPLHSLAQLPIRVVVFDVIARDLTFVCSSKMH